MESSADASSQSAPSGGRADVLLVKNKLKKFTFTKDIRITLLQAVRVHDAHKAPHGKKEKYFSKVLDTVITNLPSSLWITMQKLTIKTMRDKLRCMMADRREVYKINANSSGIAKTIGPAEELLDDFLHEVQELEEARARERNETTAREETLIQAGEQIQQSAVTRRVSVREEATGSSRSTPKKRLMKDDNDAWEDAIEYELKQKRIARVKELELRAEEFKLNRERWEEEKLHKEHSHEIEKKHMDLLISLIEKQNEK